ncbi:hypothetical protein ACFYPH_06380 [Micromonospora sp. NPDC005252]|uniref:hypothetical protein n=1 Tax=Micromonospora sp. NPDC005252 TaxID=3364228 RepID=UPI00369E9A1E
MSSPTPAPPDDVGELADALAQRQSRLWQVTSPGELAAWALAEPEPVPLDPGPADFDGDWTDGLDGSQQAAWALAGWVTRMTVPEAAATAGRHWLLSRIHHGGGSLLRLTVGVLETFGVLEDGAEVWLRVFAAPLDSAADGGALDADEWERRGVELLRDGTKTLADDKYLLRCPDIRTAQWLLRQPPVLAGARMLNGWVAAGPFPFAGRYRPETAARAWLAAETLLDAESQAAPPIGGWGFDRPYAGSSVPVELPPQRSFDAAAYRAGVSEHDRLCRVLVDHLTASGIPAGAGLAGVNVDLAWRDTSGRQFIAEVKSVVDGNEVEQLRLGLGQVLEYRHRLAALGMPVTVVLLVSRVSDPSWQQVCAANGVALLAGDADAAWLPLTART